MYWLADDAQVIPLFCPPLKFINMYGQNDCYSPTNPALWISDTGAYVLLVRAVNYRKFHDYTFTLSEPTSNSVYMVQRGEDVYTLLQDTAERVHVDYGAAVHRTYWRGPEDIRFLTPPSVLATVPELTPGGHPSVFRARLVGTTLSQFEPLEPNTTPQKNWMPYGSGWVYSVHPWVVHTPTPRTLPFDTQCLAGYHGSTNGVLVDGWWWFIIHDKKDHRWLRLRADEGAADVSEPFAFFRNTYIEFCCSVSYYRGDLWIALGCNDAHAYVVRIPLPILKLTFTSLK